MTSIFSFLASGLNAFDIFTQIHNDPHFVQLVQNIQNNDYDDLLHTYIKNTITSTFDDYMAEVFKNDEMIAVFTNNELSKLEQSKLFLGRAILHIYDKYESVLSKFVIFPKEMLVIMVVETLNDIENIDEIQNPQDVYCLIVDYYTQYIVDLFDKNITPILQKHLDSDNKKIVFDKVSIVIDNFNQILEYESKYYLSDNFYKDTSSSSSDSSSNNSSDELLNELLNYNNRSTSSSSDCSDTENEDDPPSPPKQSPPKQSPPNPSPTSPPKPSPPKNKRSFDIYNDHNLDNNDKKRKID